MKKALPIVGFGFVLLGALFFVAGGPTMNVMPRSVANFWGIAASMAGVVLWVIYGATRSHGESREAE